jgi:DNA-binding LacI/PurR family transcriptional regulator
MTEIKTGGRTAGKAARQADSKATEKTPPRYEQARREVEDFIRVQGLKPGDRLPSEDDLRREFGWSRMTITRALNELTWEGRLRRVQGSGTYVAEPAASGKPRRILVSSPVVHGNSPAYSGDDDYCAPLFAGIREEAAAQRVDIVYQAAGGIPEPSAVEEYGVDGVLSLAWRMDDLPRVLSLHEAGVRIVALALRSRAHHLPLLSTDNFEGVSRAVKHLLENGHRRIAFSTVNMANSDVFERLSGFQYTMAQAGLAVDPAYLQVSGWRRDVSFLEAWWRSMSPKPTALLLDGTDAPAVLAALRRQNVRIPEDLSVIVVDEVQALRHHDPPLTVLRQPTYELGRRGLAKLLAMLSGTDQGGPEVLPTELILRESVRPCPVTDAILAVSFAAHETRPPDAPTAALVKTVSD